MKIAQALSLRADYQKRIAQIKERLISNAKVQEGDKPAEEPDKLLLELNSTIEGFESIVAKINLTNSGVKINGLTLTEIIAKKDSLSLKISVLREFLSAASGKVDRYSQKEIKILSTVDVSTLQTKVDSLSKELRELDVLLQEANWTNELL